VTPHLANGTNGVALTLPEWLACDNYEHTDSDAPTAARDSSVSGSSEAAWSNDAAARGDAPAAKLASPIDAHWIDLARAPEFVTTEPPPQTWLFKRCHGPDEVGVLPKGKTGLLTAAGGIGKTMALIHFAIGQARGGFVFDTFRAVEHGHVLLALGEEDAAEIHRRLWRALNALELSLHERLAMAERIHVLPLHGVPVALTFAPTPGVVTETEFAGQLRSKLDGHGVDWSLIILDPLSRWAGGGVETNNEAATRFCQVVETLTGVRGKPTVLVAHHSSQNSTQAGSSDARGVTGIRDGFRWQASLDAVVTEDGDLEGVRLSNPKSNYSMRFPPLLLLRNSEPGIEGTLRLATPAEAQELGERLPRSQQNSEQRNKATRSRKQEIFDAECTAVLGLVPMAPKHTSVTAILTELRAAGTPKGDKTVKGILEHLAAKGFIVDLSSGAQSKARQWARRDP